MTQSHEPDETSAADLDANAPTAADARADMNASQSSEPHDQPWEEEEEEEIEEEDEEDEDEYEDDDDDGLEEDEEADEEDDGDDDEELLSEEELGEDDADEADEDIEDGADEGEDEDEGEDDSEDEVEGEEDGEYEYEHEHEHAEEGEGLENLIDDGEGETLLAAAAVVAAAAQDDPHSGDDGGDDDADQQPAADSPRSADTAAARTPLPPVAVTRIATDGPPAGIRRGDDNGLQLLDALAGRSSVFGFSHAPITAAITAAAGGYLGDGSAWDGSAWDAPGGDDGPLRSEWSDLLAGDDAIAADSLWLCSSADMAVETAIALARRWQSGKRFRTIALLGSDHGRSGTCLTASGRPQLHEGYGPMMAGFSHVPPGDLKAIEAAIDDQTACVLLCPVQLHSAARPLDADYLTGVRRLCDQHGLLLVIDETQLMLGGSGSLFSFRSIASIRADMVVVAAGLFAGLPGGLVLADAKVTGGAVTHTDRYPLAAAVASETCLSLLQRRLPESAAESVHAFAVALAEQIAGFEFVRDLHVTGMTIGIETDIESTAILRTAARHGLRIESAGPTAIRLQPPLVLSDQDRTALLSTLGDVLTAIEQETVELSV